MPSVKILSDFITASSGGEGTSLISVGFSGISIAVAYDTAQQGQLKEQIALVTLRDACDKEAVSFRACFPKSWQVPEDQPDDLIEEVTRKDSLRRQVRDATNKAWSLFSMQRSTGAKGMGLGASIDFCLPDDP